MMLAALAICWAFNIVSLLRWRTRREISDREPFASVHRRSGSHRSPFKRRGQQSLCVF
jgi:hypothetical protein